MTEEQFRAVFVALTGNESGHFPWQWALYQQFATGDFPQSCNLPTGLGKTSVIVLWLIALANSPTLVPRRLVYVVNRRTVVDQSTEEARKLTNNLPKVPELQTKLGSLAISTLRGQFADNRKWSADPSRPAVIVGTVDMIGSRLLFSGYGVGFKGKPLHAGFLGQDVLLVHDEAHLEPAFQELLIAIEKEQKRCKEFGKLRVMELSATSRGQEQPFELTPADSKNVVVMQRITAKKVIHLHENQDEKRLADEVADLALRHKDSGRAVLVFVRKVDNVEKIVKKLPKGSVQQLTGTLRGLERDRMAEPRKETGCPIFARFLKPPKPDGTENERWKIEPKSGTVYLVCTSAGEVGVNISGDHLVCDLSTFENMVQRFGRVNRFGDRADTEIHVVRPKEFDEKDDYESRLKKTLELLQQLKGDGSPAALGKLDPKARQAAFAPPPTILHPTDILFDSWALTTIRGKLPGRPPVEPYLHGLSSELPETRVAWREEVGVITGELLKDYKPEDLLEDYPLKPYEQLRDRSDRVFKHLTALAGRRADDPVWLLNDDGRVEVFTLDKLADKDKKDRVNYRTVLLPPSVGGLRDGLLNGDSDVANDVSDSDEWRDENGNPRRVRVWGDQPVSKDMRRISTIDTKPDADEAEDEESTGLRFWRWYELPKAGDGDGSKSNKMPVLWQVHTDDVVKNVTDLVARLPLSDGMKRAVILAAKFHDLGKRRTLFQKILGNFDAQKLLAKSGKKKSDRVPEQYRHEFGSLLDVLDQDEFKALKDNPELQELILHLIAVHHGRGRPHFPPDEAFDPEPNGKNVREIAADVPRRFARLQRKFGRWGLAYLESLLRAADYAASANPSAFLEEKK